MDGNIAFLAAGLGAGIGVFGAALGIGRIGAAGLEGMARQPSIASELRTSSLLVATLIEGVALFAMVVCVLLASKT